jgi:hypothetical protein
MPVRLFVPSNQVVLSSGAPCPPVSIDTQLARCEGIGLHPLWDAQNAI